MNKTTAKSASPKKKRPAKSIAEPRLSRQRKPAATYRSMTGSARCACSFIWSRARFSDREPWGRASLLGICHNQSGNRSQRNIESRFAVIVQVRTIAPAPISPPTTWAPASTLNSPWRGSGPDEGKRPPSRRAFQAPFSRAVRRARRAARLIGDEMGLGKTIQAIAAAEIMARHFGVERVLIVCPTSLKHQWQREIARFTEREAQVIHGLRARRAAAVRRGTPSSRSPTTTRCTPTST